MSPGTEHTNRIRVSGFETGKHQGGEGRRRAPGFGAGGETGWGRAAEGWRVAEWPTTPIRWEENTDLLSGWVGALDIENFLQQTSLPFKPTHPLTHR